MIKMYDKPREVKLIDLFPTGGKKYYIQTFAYGDYDNEVTAVLYETSVVIGDYSFNPKDKKDGKYRVYFRTTYVSADEAEKSVGGLHNCQRKFEGYGNDYRIGNLEDLGNITVTVNGEWTRE